MFRKSGFKMVALSFVFVVSLALGTVSNVFAEATGLNEPGECSSPGGALKGPAAVGTLDIKPGEDGGRSGIFYDFTGKGKNGVTLTNVFLFPLDFEKITPETLIGFIVSLNGGQGDQVCYEVLQVISFVSDDINDTITAEIVALQQQ